MKKALTIFLAILTISSYSQNASVFNGYSYIYLPPLEYESGAQDVYGIRSAVRGHFVDKGFGIVVDLSNPDKLFQAIKDNPCVVLTCSIDHPSPNQYSNKVNLKFYNCLNQLVYSTSGSGGMGLDVAGDFRIAVKKALREFNSQSYKYNQFLTPEIKYPEVPYVSENVSSLREYFTNFSLDPIEGLYKSYQSDQLGHYEFGIKKYGNSYKAIITESANKIWKTGEVKAVFEQSSMKGLFSATWYMGNKRTFETFATLNNSTILEIEFKDAKTGDNRTDMFIKMYPKSDQKFSNSEGVNGVTGSGFVLSRNGIIATNAHVIEGMNEISVSINSDIGVLEYSATIILRDEANDIALIRIDDAKFKGFANIPFGVSQSTSIGEDVFTIGYPLSSVMGNNFKVTNGIVSSLSGIKDDVRYIQTTVALQPGNSGGPLFDNKGNVIGITSSRLNSEAVGTSVQNVSYAIKASYLLSLYHMLPNEEQPKSESVQLKSRSDMVSDFKNYVCLIRAKK